MRCCVMIPCYEPDEKLVKLCSELSEHKLDILVVNDGSTKKLEIFDIIADIPLVSVIGYDTNRGKGNALKFGFKYLHERGYDACVTADSDGQHIPRDILRIIDELEKTPDKLILGERDKSLMPPKSKTGNSLTCLLFRLLYGIKLADTQTGLRGIPLKNIDDLVSMAGERYEYEMEMLIESPRLFSGVVEIPIETIYIDNNRESHFRPIQDGAKIYSVLFKKLPGFLLSSVLSFAVDYGLFNILYYLLAVSSVPATAVARAVSGTINYLINKNVVFRGQNEHYTFWKYWSLAIAILIVNMLLIKLLVDVLGVPAFLGKILVEIVLYFVNFTIQNRWIYKK